jgi:hypothetical protein
LTVAIDSDRDAWTQAVLRCDSAGRRWAGLLTRLAPAATLKHSYLPVQARRDEAGWTVELGGPHLLLGASPDQVSLLRVQVVVTIQSDPGKPARLYLTPQADDRLLPHRYALLALPQAARSDVDPGPR